MSAVAAEQDDVIEILSSYTEDNEFYFQPEIFIQETSQTIPLAPTGPRVRTQEPEKKEKETRTKEQRCVARVVMSVAFVMLLMSVMLVAISLTMTDHIDKMVRNANSYMQKELQKEAAKNGDVVNSAISSENVTETPVT